MPKGHTKRCSECRNSIGKGHKPGCSRPQTKYKGKKRRGKMQKAA